MTAMEILTGILSILSLAGTVLITKQDRRGFALWIVANTGWVVVDYQAGVYAQSLLFFVYLILAVWGWVRWKRPA